MAFDITPFIRLFLPVYSFYKIISTKQTRRAGFVSAQGD
jgi:hypothetical protein